jgi:hypothetical protein
MIISGSSSAGGGTTTAVNASEGGNPGFFSPVDSSFSSIQIGWTVVGHPELGTVTNVVYVPDNYAVITTLSGYFNYGTNYAFTDGSGTGVTIAGGVTIL